MIMRNKLYLFAIVTVTFVNIGCQKDYYLDDLREAEEQIELLQSSINGLQADITEANALNTTLTNQLSQAANDLETSYQANIALGNINGELNSDINTLIGRLQDAHAEIDRLNAEINLLNASSTNSITILQDQVNNLQSTIDSYVPIVEEVIVEVERIVYIDRVEYITNTVTDTVEVFPVSTNGIYVGKGSVNVNGEWLDIVQLIDIYDTLVVGDIYAINGLEGFTYRGNIDGNHEFSYDSNIHDNIPWSRLSVVTIIG